MEKRFFMKKMFKTSNRKTHLKLKLTGWKTIFRINKLNLDKTKNPAAQPD